MEFIEGTIEQTKMVLILIGIISIQIQKSIVRSMV
jgi:hypothetical protein